MPSQRRVRVVAVFAAVIILSILYFTSSASQSNREFYDRTVAAMDARQKASQVDDIRPDTPDPDLLQKLKEAEERSAMLGYETRDQEVETLRKPPEVVTKSDSEGKAAGGKKWDTGERESSEPKKDEESEEEKDVKAELNSILKRSPIIIFSKTYCPFSKKAKAIFDKYSITPAPFIVELDEHPMGSQLQSALEKATGRRTVPNVLVSGSTIGGGDDVAALHEKGELVSKIKSLGGKRIMEITLKKD